MVRRTKQHSAHILRKSVESKYLTFTSHVRNIYSQLTARGQTNNPTFADDHNDKCREIWKGFSHKKKRHYLATSSSQPSKSPEVISQYTKAAKRKLEIGK